MFVFPRHPYGQSSTKEASGEERAENVQFSVVRRIYYLARRLYFGPEACVICSHLIGL